MDINTLYINVFSTAEVSAINMVDMYVREYFKFSYKHFFRKVAEEGNLAFSRWLFQHYISYPENASKDDSKMCEAASISGNLKLIKFLLKCGFQFESQYNAAFYKQRKILAWCHKYKILDSVTAYTGAVNCEDLDCMKWLFFLGYNLNIQLCCLAVEKGNLEILKWLVYNNCNIDKDECLRLAIRNSYSVIVKYLLESYDYTETFSLHSEKIEGHYYYSDYFDSAVSSGKIEIVTMLLDHKCPPSMELNKLIDLKEYKLVIRCIELGSAWTFKDYNGNKNLVMDTSPQDYRELVSYSESNKSHVGASCAIC